MFCVALSATPSRHPPLRGRRSAPVATPRLQAVPHQTQLPRRRGGGAMARAERPPRPQATEASVPHTLAAPEIATTWALLRSAPCMLLHPQRPLRLLLPLRLLRLLCLLRLLLPLCPLRPPRPLARVRGLRLRLLLSPLRPLRLPRLPRPPRPPCKLLPLPLQILFRLLHPLLSQRSGRSGQPLQSPCIRRMPHRPLAPAPQTHAPLPRLPQPCAPLPSRVSNLASLRVLSPLRAQRCLEA